MDEADDMMTIAEERQRKSVERATKKMRGERKQNNLDARLTREKNRNIDDLVDVKDDFINRSKGCRGSWSNPNSRLWKIV